MIPSFLRRTALAVLASLTFAFSLPAATVVSSFADIQYWVGTGSNQAALVIDWKDGSETASFAWGFRWNGTASGEDMLRAIAGMIGTNTTPAVADGTGDPSLTLYTQFFAGFGNAVYQIEYPGHAAGGFDSDSPGYWSYFTADGTADLPATWISSSVGMGGRTLANNSWDSWAWDADFVDPAPSPDAPVAAVPEPAIIALLAASGVALIAFRRFRHA